MNLIHNEKQESKHSIYINKSHKEIQFYHNCKQLKKERAHHRGRGEGGAVGRRNGSSQSVRGETEAPKCTCKPHSHTAR